MARKQPSEIFLEYEKQIVADPAYAGMPDLYYEDGRIQWETPSNRKSGEYRFSHDKRLSWWEAKATQLGISTDQAHWISRVAKQIHPTKKKPCKICGRVMDIRYAYLGAHFIKAVKKLPYVDSGLELSECTHILDFIVDFENLYGTESLNDLRPILKCKAVPLDSIPSFSTSEEMIEWLNDVYIPSEPSKLGPGSMSNAPDRLDGFHTYNRCCRPKEDRGRSKANLASYSTDRRAFEYWVDGNWIAANKAMGMFRTRDELKALPCLNEGNGDLHPIPCDADHIGPISLGFMHRPVFQPLCSTCNSSKNNRMYHSDVQKLIAAERDGQCVVTWYARTIWDELKDKITSNSDAVKLSRMMRDNRHCAMTLLGSLLKNGHVLFLSTLLGLSYADYSYEQPHIQRHNNGTVSFDFVQKPSDLKYKQIQKARRLRVGFQALRDYNSKDNRNWFSINLPENEPIYKKMEEAICHFERTYLPLCEKLVDLYEGDFADTEVMKSVVDEIPTAEVCDELDTYQTARSEMQRYMDNIGMHLASMWLDPRFDRNTYDI